MDLSVIVLSYNHPELTARTLSSVLKFSFKKVILIHNGSENKHIFFLKNKFPNIEHIILPKNLGFAGGASQGLQHGFLQSSWCLFLTNDTELLKVASLPKQPSFVGLQIFKRKTEITDSIGGTFNPSRGELKHCKTAIEFFNTTQYRYIPGTAFLLHKDIFTQTNGFDESLFTYWEDVDLSLRAQQLGFTVNVDENWHVRHAIGKTCHSKSIYSLYYFQRNRKRVSLTYCPKNQIYGLYFYLVKDWLRLSLKLVAKKRFSDLKILLNAIRA